MAKKLSDDYKETVQCKICLKEVCEEFSDGSVNALEVNMFVHTASLDLHVK